MAIAYDNVSHDENNVDDTSHNKTHQCGAVQTTSDTIAGTGADSAAVGTLTWSNPGNITVSDNTRASVTASGNVSFSHYLKATNFGFAIPSDATILGIQVKVERIRSGGSAGQIRDKEVKIVKADGTIGTTNKADTVNNWDNVEETKTYGSTSDLWGETWTPANINDSDFGVVIAITGSTSGTDRVANVDSVKIAVSYAQFVDGVLVVAVMTAAAAAAPSAVNYNNVAMSLVRTITNTRKITMWILADPDIGANNLEVEFAISTACGVAAMSFTGVDQTTPNEADNGATGNSTTASVAVTTVSSNAWIVDAVAVANAVTLTVGADQTSRSSNNTAGVGVLAMSHEGPKASAGSATMSWGISVSGTWEIGAIVLKPAGGSTAHSKNLNDTITIADTATKYPKKNLTDSMTMAEAASNKPKLGKTDTMNVADSSVRYPKLGKTDTVTLADALTRVAGMSRTDVVVISDSLARVVSKILADSFSISDSVSTLIVLQIMLSDTQLISDAIAKAMGKNATDIFSLADSLVKTGQVNLSDNVSAADTITKLVTKALLDTIVVSESLQKSIGLSKSDSLVVTDALNKSAIKIVSDAFIIADTIAKTTGLTPDDTVVLAETIVKSVTLRKSDSFTIAEFLNNTARLSIQDTVNFIDTITRANQKHITDLLTIADAAAKASGKYFADSIEITDSLDHELGHIASRIYIPYADRYKRKRGVFSSKSTNMRKKGGFADASDDFSHKKLFS